MNAIGMYTETVRGNVKKSPIIIPRLVKWVKETYYESVRNGNPNSSRRT